MIVLSTSSATPAVCFRRLHLVEALTIAALTNRTFILTNVGKR